MKPSYKSKEDPKRGRMKVKTRTLDRVRKGGERRALASQQDSEIAHYREIYLAVRRLITAGQSELEESRCQTEQNEPRDRFNKRGDGPPAAPTDN